MVRARCDVANYIIALTSWFLLDPFGELRGVVAEVLTVVIQITAVLLALAIATGFLEAQLSYVVGAPSVLSALWFKIGAVIVCLIIALTAVSISNTLVGILF
jgi:hypothetical protein